LPARIVKAVFPAPPLSLRDFAPMSCGQFPQVRERAHVSELLSGATCHPGSNAVTCRRSLPPWRVDRSLSGASRSTAAPVAPAQRGRFSVQIAGFESQLACLPRHTGRQSSAEFLRMHKHASILLVSGADVA
jgi:hypothetical protein